MLCEGKRLWFILMFGEKTAPQKLPLLIHALKIGHWGEGDEAL